MENRRRLLWNVQALCSRAPKGYPKLGPRIDPSIFDGIFGPSYRLTPRRPYQASPAAWLNASTVGDYYAAYDYIVWSMPQQGGPDSQGFMTFSFEHAPTMRSVVSISLEGKAWSGKTGHVRLGSEAPSASISFPITDAYAAHTVDLSFVPVSGQPTVIWMVLETGIEIMTFRSVSFACSTARTRVRRRSEDVRPQRNHTKRNETAKAMTRPMMTLRRKPP